MDVVGVGMMDSYRIPTGWREIDGTRENKKQFVHADYDIWVHVVHDANQYPRDGESHYHEDEYDQIMRWRAWVTLGESITCGINEYAICHNGCKENEKEVMQWAIEWMCTDFEFLDDDTLSEWEK